MSALPVEELLAPLGGDAPCGDDLEYDPAFIALEEAARGKPEQQYGDTVIPAQEPDWREVHEQALSVAQRTRDLRVAVLLARSGARLGGLGAYADGLELIAGLLEQQWDHVFPLLDAEDNNDPTMRLNALAPLVDGSAGMADLRAAAIGPGRLALTVRQIELASGKADPHGDETVPSQEAIVQGVRDLAAQQAGTLEGLKRPLDAVNRIEAAIEQRVGAQGPDLKPLQIVARWLAQAAAQAEAGGAIEATDAGSDVDFTGGGAAGFAPAAVQAIGAIRSRDDVVRTLDSICKWIEQNEPTNPAPLLIRRAQRLMGKNFLEIIRDLVPDGLDQVEKIAGTNSE